jgi:multiple sugar transport system permease protein
MSPFAWSAAESPSERIALRLALPLALLLWLLPLAAVALTSVRSINDLGRGNYWGWPTETHFIENYAGVLQGSHLFQYLVNSLVITLSAMTGTVILACMAGYALAKFRFPGGRLLLVMFVAGNLMPFQVMMIPVRELMVAFDLYDTRLALILFHVAFQTGFCTLFMRNFFLRVPGGIFDAARLDGWGEFRIFAHIAVPLVAPAVAGMASLVFTFVWNDYFWALVLVQSDDVRPVTAGLQTMRGMWLTSWNLISAGALLAALPPALIFFIMQRHFIAGLTAGSGEG